MKKTVVYTPPEIVDFIEDSVKEILKSQFNADMSDPNVSILEPFVGDGRFLVKLIEDADDPDAIFDKMQGYELDPAACKVAKQNIEAAYKKRTGRHREFKGIYNLDTFEVT